LVPPPARFEIPELTSGAVVVAALAREPGVRTKVAVPPSREGIDPGRRLRRATRVRKSAASSASWGRERVDIIRGRRPAQLVRNALRSRADFRASIDS